MKEKINGLSSEEVQERINDGKVNVTKKDNLKSNWRIIFDNVFTLFNLYNLIIAIALVCVKAYTNTFFFFIIAINVIIGIVQEIHGKNMVKRLSILSASKATVIRDGKEQKIEAEKIVLDDVILLAQGDQIPSDSYVIKGTVEVNEALLTGESDLILKKENDKLLSGSYIASGKCYAKVEKVGEDNFANQIISATKKYKENDSELINSMKKVTKFTSFVIIPVGIILFIQAYFFRGNVLEQSVIATSAALLGMLPKGLVLLITIALESGVIKLAKRMVLVQEAYSIESLAHIDTICLDKTGTITKGKMKVSEVKMYEEKLLPKSFSEMMTAFVNGMEDNNETFKALKKYFRGDNNFEKVSRVAFSSERKWSSISFKEEGTIVLGAPEKLFQKSRMEMPEEIESLQKNGKRVLGIAYTTEVIKNEELPELKIIAMLVLEDPLRKNAKEMLGYFKQQGIDVKVISGDNPLTVSNIAKKAGLEDYESYIDLSTINTDAEIVDLVDKYSIFARVLPHQKSIIVKALQAKKHKVAMTGDGVNDVIALRESDCSITLPNASDAAKQVSQIVLLNSDFSVLKDVLMEGRRVVNNITKVARIFFIKTIYSVLLSLFCILTNTGFPFIPIQITLIDLAIEAYTSFFITFEKNEKVVNYSFLKRALINALPFALVIMFNIICLTIVGNIMEIPQEVSTTMMYLLIGFVSILAVQEVCKPYTKPHIFLFVTTLVGFYVAVVLFRNLLKISTLENMQFIIVGILAVISYILIAIKRKIYSKKAIV
ncbi:MAG TPA: cation-translocating P-type ATPase [Candidatus Merdicola faecigallinarum]|uniref:Cation-translocating P-type ATPase n=1 Tax=Candidatus Merdicola faecigallinarum TaxID=2840862 RepID=A0A9D1S9K4_9FIRM|nr:cation-translocating P-type ATPase [Candidatus Merdicola faecigallinarum]